MTVLSTTTSATLRDVIRPAQPGERELDDLAREAGAHQFVLIGEATHGTQEFYEQRAILTRKLITDYGFNAVAVEADWPDAYRVNTYVRGRTPAHSAEHALRGFTRFPHWMWRNTVVEEFVEWLRDWNARRPQGSLEVGFYGLDLYSLFTSIAAVLQYLERVDPDAFARAKYRYSCFEDYEEDEQAYGYAAAFDLGASCESDAVAMLTELRERRREYARADGVVEEDEAFEAEQNARLVVNAAEYYRAMFRTRISTWNLRDQHMADTLDQLAEHLQRTYGDARIVVWEHNSHVGDARATGMARRGELNVGQLVRERHGGEGYIIGFTTHHGTVLAADDWGDKGRRMRINPALPESYEHLFHELGVPSFVLPTAQAETEALAPRLERAIGVIYRPETERISHYIDADIARQFDTVIHIDRTRALQPLAWKGALGEDLPETFPFEQ